MTPTTLILVLAVGAVTGFLGGLFGKGGSALATPVLAALGVPPIVAVASPLPATVPATLLAARQYARRGLVDRRVLAWAAGVGLPATVAGALVTRWVDAESLVVGTELLVIGLGISILWSVGRRARDARADTGPDVDAPAPDPTDGADDPDGGGGGVAVAVSARTEVGAETSTARVAAVAVTVGFLAGLLANSGGFLLAPLFLVVLKLPVRTALGTSLAASAALALPGTLTHTVLGHVDWGLVLAFGAASIPLSAAGARCALRIHPERLEVVFGAVLVVATTALLVFA